MNLTPDLILRAYCVGAFPMAESASPDADIHFYQPDERALFIPSDFHVPQRTQRWLKTQKLTVKYPDDVATIMRSCGERRDESWINPVLLDLYAQLAKDGFVQALGVYQDGELVGGIYWVQLGLAVMAESMFSRIPNASKLALTSLMAALHSRAQRLGFPERKQWIDVQFNNAHLAQFHPTIIDASLYQSFLDEALSFAGDASFLASDFSAGSLSFFLESLLQFRTQIS